METNRVIYSNNEDIVNTERYITIRTGNICIANKIKTFFSKNDFEELAEEIKNDIASNWRISPDSCSWGIYESLESIYPYSFSKNWNINKI